MKEEYMQFGEYIKTKRKKRELTVTQVSEHLGMSRSYYSEIENKIKPPFDEEKMELFAEFLDLSERETALLYDLASKYKGTVPSDIKDIFIHEEVGELARYALRLSKWSDKPEAKWKQLIRELEAEKRANNENARNGGES